MLLSFLLPFIWLISALGTRILLPYRVSGHSLAPIPQRKWARRLCLRVASPARGKCYNNPPTLNKALLPLLTPGHNSFKLELLLTFFSELPKIFCNQEKHLPWRVFKEKHQMSQNFSAVLNLWVVKQIKKFPSVHQTWKESVRIKLLNLRFLTKIITLKW